MGNVKGLQIESREGVVSYLEAEMFPPESIEPWLGSRSRYADGRTPDELCEEGHFEMVAFMGICFMANYTEDDFLAEMEHRGSSREQVQRIISGEQADVISLDSLRKILR